MEVTTDLITVSNDKERDRETVMVTREIEAAMAY